MATPERETWGVDAEEVVDYLIGRGVIANAVDVTRLTPLTGGVSGDVTLVEAAGQRMVVKRARPQLLVRDEWFAKCERAITEAAAMELVHRFTPNETPRVLYVDRGQFTLVMTAAPIEWQPWKTRLLQPKPSPQLELATASALGRIVGSWHRATAGDRRVAHRFDDYEALEQLRIGPFHRVVAHRHPDVAEAIGVCVDDLLTRRDCLVHGDFSPKNVLTGPNGLMVVDFEVAHFGAAVFDAAFLNCHLLLKAAHCPQNARLMRQISAAFFDRYVTERGTAPGPRLGWHTACLMLARVDGISPATYLDDRAASVVRETSLAILREPDHGMAKIWTRIEEYLS